MKTQKDAIKIVEILKETYPDAKCSLDFASPFEMMVAVMLSAQCTDARVNLTTPALFKEYNTPEKMANIDIKVLENIIHPCGFYKNKAKNIIAASKMLVEKYNSTVPDDIDELMKIPGVGRKSANVIMLEAFKTPMGIAVDTHAKRISNRLGLSSELDPLKIEQDLIKIYPEKYFYDINHLFIEHGRNCCTARKPDCANCKVKELCDSFNKL